MTANTNGNGKSPDMERTLNQAAMAMFGRERTPSQCVTCGSLDVKDEDFRDPLSIKEFGISRMCQGCQDKTFGEDREDSIPAEEPCASCPKYPCPPLRLVGFLEKNRPEPEGEEPTYSPDCNCDSCMARRGY